jgi:hypothetical protein
MTITDTVKSLTGAHGHDSLDKEYHGFAVMGRQGSGGKYDVQPFSYPHKKFADDDLEIKIEASGICGSDLHTCVQPEVFPTYYLKRRRQDPRGVGFV